MFLRKVSRTTYIQQLSENTMVKEELELVKEGSSNVYKLTGPVLVKQDLSEAKGNVAKRIEFIQGELKRIEQTQTELEAKLAKSRETIMKAQQQLQTQQQQQQQQLMTAS